MQSLQIGVAVQYIPPWTSTLGTPKNIRVAWITKVVTPKIVDLLFHKSGVVLEEAQGIVEATPGSIHGRWSRIPV